MPGHNDNGDSESSVPPGARGRGKQIEPEVIAPTGDSGGSGGDSYDFQDDGEASETVPLADIDADWTEFFPFDEPYADQVDGINAFIEALSDNEYMMMEGACGTGKTLVGLTAGIQYLRNHESVQETVSSDAPEYDRILVATPVKQQLKQFIEEMETINERLETQSPLSTVVMRGQADVLPYARVDHEPFDEYGVTSKIDDLREMTYHLLKFGSDIPLDWPDGFEPSYWSRYDYDWRNPSEEASEMRDQYKLDPDRAEAVVQILSKRVDAGEDPLVVDGVTSPFPDSVPHTTEVADSEELQRTGSMQLPIDLQGKFDPFYAGFFAHDRLPFWFEDASQSVMDAESLFELGVTHGVCPHQSMAEMMDHADVLIGNYYHVFDPQTRLLTDMKTSVLDEGTICILDEAHNIEETVRDILSDSKGIHSLRTAMNDIRAAIGYLAEDPSELPQSELPGIDDVDLDEARIEAEEAFDLPAYDTLSQDDLSNAIEFLQYLEGLLKSFGEDHLDERFDSGWEWVAENRRSWLRAEDISLEDPESDDPDELQEAISEQYGDDAWRICYDATRAASDILEAVTDAERTPQCKETGRFFYRWQTESHIDYFREVVLERTRRDYPLDDNHRWTSEWTPKYQLYNCIPTKKLREVFSELGAGLLMSATLDPIDELVKTTGIGQCVHPDSVEDKEERGLMVRSGEADSDDDVEFRDVTVRRYPLRFPRENRVSIGVQAPKYTYGNRGDPTIRKSSMTSARKIYAELLQTVAASNGNVLICMPSYREAEWAHNLLSNSGVAKSKDVMLDQSSSSAETDETLGSFFENENAVILTSTRGTITEGVDYNGDKLHCCAVVGVSLLPPKDRHKAVERAYDERLEGTSGFEATNKIPAARKARQAIGRVIRGSDEVGARLLIDERYTDSGWSGVKQYLSEQEQHEFMVTQPENIQQHLQAFWDDVHA